MKVLSKPCLAGFPRRLFLWLASTLIPVAVNSGQIYYLSPAGNDPQPGTQARPFGFAPDTGCYEQRPLALQLLQANPAGLRIRLLGGAGKSYGIETSPALTNWNVLSSMVRSNLALEVLITNDGTRRFYRAAWML